MGKKILSLILSFVLLICTVSVVFEASAASYADQLRSAGFPDSYIDDLVSLHNKYPNWEFKPLKTGLNWSTVVSGERKSHSNQMIERGYDSYYYCTCSSCSSKSGSLRPASQWAVEYFMDPRNWLDEKHIFQFESTEYNSSHTQSGVEALISSTWMHNSNITYLNTLGSSVTYKDSSGNAVKYSAAIMQAAKSSNLSAYYIASRIVKEVGSSKPTASGVVGNKSPFNGMYNYYSIGAASSGTQGLEWASGFLKTNKSTTLYSSYNSSTKTASGTQTTLSSGQKLSYIGYYGDYYRVKVYTDSSGYSTNGATGYVLKSDLRTSYFTYERPWTSPYKAIIGGAEYISASYSKQYTSYLQKFNVNPNSSSLYGHEYMTNVNAVSVESVSMYNAYNKAGQLSTKKTFYIPVFNNMPDDTSSVGEWKKSNGYWYYYVDGEMVTGWKKISGKWYYFNTSGVMQTGWQKISGKWYYFNAGGDMRTGWLKDDGKWYYLDSSNGAMVTYMNYIDGKTYYFNGAGAMQTGWLTISSTGAKYYFGSDGAAYTGWHTFNNKNYYFNSKGDMHKGWLEYEGNYYYLSSDGPMLTYRQKIGGKLYYFNGAGKMQKGWLKLSEKWYYFTSCGAAQTGWLTLSGKTYYFNSDCQMVTYLQKISGKRYYFNGSGALYKGWLTINNKKHYFGSDGAEHIGWLTLDGKKYYFNSNGEMLTYLQKIGDKKYYFSGAGVMYKGWLTISGKRYYFGTDGAMVTGTHTIDGKEYTFDENGALEA